MDIITKLRNGDYDVKLKYPPSDKVIEETVTREMEDFVGTQAQINAEKARRITEAKAHKELGKEDYYAEQQRLNKQFKADLFEQFGVTNHPKAQHVYDLATQYSSGREDMIDRFDEFVSLITEN